jgi:hypothetical protein
MFIGLVIMAAILPSVLSNKHGTRYALQALNSQLRGRVGIQDVNLSWRSPSTLDGITVLDPQQRQVLNVSQVTIQQGLWHFVRTPMSFGDVELDQPHAVVYLQEDQPPSLVQAFDLQRPSATQPARADEEGGPPPEPKGQLIIHSGTVRVVKPDGQELAVRGLNGQVTLDTLDNIRGQVGAVLDGGGQIRGEANIQDLVANGQIDANQATGQFTVRTDEPVDLDPLLAFFDQRGIHGQASLDVQGQLDRGALQADLRTQVNQFHTQAVQGETQVQPQPVDLALVGRVERSATEQVSGRFDLTGGVGTANAQFAYAPSNQPADAEATGAPAAQPAQITGEDLVALLLTGKPVDLPNVQADAKADLNLQALAAAMPNIVRIQEGVEITQGQLQIPDLQVRTQPTLTAVAVVEVSDLAATRSGQPVDIQPIALNINAHVVPEEGLQVERGQLQSSFANADVQGSASNLQGKFDADLAKMDQQMRQLVELGDFSIAGTLNGQFTVARASEEEVKVTSNIRAADVHYTSGEKKLNVQQATLNPDASLLLQNQNLQRVVLHGLDADVDRQILATAEGWYDFGDKAWKTDVTVQQAQLPYLVTLGRDLGVQAFEQYAGYSGSIADLKLTAGWNPQAGALTSNGGGAIAGLGRDGTTVSENIGLQWQEVSYIAKTQAATLGSATVKAGFANLAAENVKFQSGETMALDGRITATADVARTLAAAYTLIGQQQPPAIGGQLNLASNMNTQGGVVTLAGEVTVNDFEVGAGGQALRQQQVQLAYDTRIDNANETIDLRQARLTSSPLTANLAGTVQQFRSRQVLDLRGDYRATWDQVMPIVHQFAPATATTVDLRGDSASRFTVAGPAWQEGAQPPYRAVTAEGFDIGWQGGNVYGLELSRAVLSPRLRNGRFELPVAQIPASGGTVSIGGTVDLTQKEPQLRIPGQLQLMQDINLNSDIGKQLLSYVNPLFSHVAGMDGRVSMVVQDIDLPLGETIKQAGSGRGQLFMQSVRVEPSGIFGVLVRIAGASQAGRGGQGTLGVLGEAGRLGQIGGLGRQAPTDQAMGAVDIRIGNPTFQISGGRINYDNFALTFPNDVQMVFSGWVGFDDTVMMYVGMPVTAGLFEIAGVKGPVAQYASVLEGVRVDVPLIGSRTDPRLDFSKIKFDNLVQQAVKNLATKGIEQGIRTAIPGGQFLPLPGDRQGQEGGLLPQLPLPRLPGQQPQQPPPPDQQQQQQEQRRPSPTEEIERGLRGIFGGGKKE